MNTDALARKLSAKGSDPTLVARSVARSPVLVEQVAEGLASDVATVRFNASKVLLAVAREAPESLRPQLSSILALLDSENKTLKAAAIRTLGHLASVDSKGQITRSLDRFLRCIPGPDLMMASNAMEGAANVACAKPRTADRVIAALLSVGRGRYKSADCREIAIGKAIEALDPLFERSARKREIREFVRKQCTSSRKATRLRAERFLRRHHES